MSETAAIDKPQAPVARPLETEVLRLALAYAAAKEAVDTHEGEYRGPAYTRKLDAWRKASRALLDAAGDYHAETKPQNRKEA